MSQEGQNLTSDDEFYLKWGRDSLKNNIGNLHDVLSKLFVVSNSLVGGSLILVNGSSEKNTLFLGFLVFLMISSILSFIGLYPFANKVDLSSPSEINNHKEKVLNRKKLFLVLSSVAFLVSTGFGIWNILLSL